MSSKEKVIATTIQKPSTFIHYCFYALFFVTPLLLWPFTSEVFEFNKMMFVYAMTIVIAAAWAFDLSKQAFWSCSNALTSLLYFLSQIVSTFISIDRHTSLWVITPGFTADSFPLFVTSSCFMLWSLISPGKPAVRNLILQSWPPPLTAFYAISKNGNR
jgi:hypothetical protein